VGDAAVAALAALDHLLLVRHRLPLPVEALTGPADVLLAPDFVAPPAIRARTIVTIHDLSYLTVPHYADPGLRRYLTAAVPRSLRRAAQVIAVSEATRREAIAHLGLPPERVTTVYNGVDARFRPLDAAARAAARARLGLPERYLLTLGTLEPRKNHAGLLRAFARLTSLEPDLTLVIGADRRARRPIFDDASPGSGRSCPLPGRCPTTISRSLCRRDRLRLSFLVRGLRPATAGGAGLRRAGRHQHDLVTAGGLRRRGAARRSGR
jgi:glycosyltransferase involved in cell wall biosynthesis